MCNASRNPMSHFFILCQQHFGPTILAHILCGTNYAHIQNFTSFQYLANSDDHIYVYSFFTKDASKKITQYVTKFQVHFTMLLRKMNPSISTKCNKSLASPHALNFPRCCQSAQQTSKKIIFAP